LYVFRSEASGTWSGGKFVLTTLSPPYFNPRCHVNQMEELRWRDKKEFKNSNFDFIS
jgi:hypothetical protein